MASTDPDEAGPIHRSGLTVKRNRAFSTPAEERNPFQGDPGRCVREEGERSKVRETCERK